MLIPPSRWLRAGQILGCFFLVLFAAKERDRCLAKALWHNKGKPPHIGAECMRPAAKKAAKTPGRKMAEFN